MAKEIKMPQWGMTMKKGKISKWLKAEGESVKKGDGLFEVETEKITNTAEATIDGQLVQIIAEEGSTVKVGKIVAIMAAEGETIEKIETASGGATDEKQVPSKKEYVPASPSAKRLAKELDIDLSDVPGTGKGGRVTETDVKQFHKNGPAQPKITPVAKNMAEKSGMDLSNIQGTGEGGKITKEDVERALNPDQKEDRSIEDTTGQEDTAPYTVMPYTGMRQAIGTNMVSSLQNAAQLTTFTELDVTELIAWKELLEKEYEKDDTVRISLNDMMIYIISRVLKLHPIMNSTFNGDEILLHNRVNMGIAVALSNGLIVPKLRNADQKSLVQISRDARDLIKRARKGELLPDEVVDGTFTITNVSSLGMDGFTPVLNPPETGILGIGRILEKPAIHNSEIVVRSRMTLSLTFDHRVADGSPAMSFLQSLARHMENPLLLMR